MNAQSSSPPQKPNVEYENPADKPSAAEMSGTPVETAMLGRQGPGGFLLMVLAIGIFVVVFGSIFYFAGL